MATNIHKQLVQKFEATITDKPEAERKAVAKGLVIGLLEAIQDSRVSPKHG